MEDRLIANIFSILYLLSSTTIFHSLPSIILFRISNFSIMLFLSIIIPAYNAGKTIVPLLSSIARSKKVKFDELEAIVVDDKSADDTVEVVQRYLTLGCEAKSPQGWKVRKVKIVCLKKNVGPAAARNIGVKYARGKVVLFLDADVLVYSNTLYEVVHSFKQDQDLHALTGVWDKMQESHKFFPKFKALRDWSYWINERDPRNYYYLFSTRIAAIDRKLFLRLGGFDTTYKAALVEDMELTYRIAKRYAVVFNPKVIVHHEFEDFWPIAKKYFWRSFYWSKIYRERKKFDPVATTGKEAMTTISAGGLVFLSLLSILSYLSHLSYIMRISIVGVIVVTAIHFWGVRKFLWFTIKEEGIFFTLKAFLTGIVLYLVILAGAMVSFWKK